MPKTFDQIKEIVDTLTGHSIVYKVECDEVKDWISRAYDQDKQIISQEFTWGGKWEQLPVHIDLPYELRHMYGLKFRTELTCVPEGAYRDAILTVKNRWYPVYNALQVLIGRQVKARRPVEKTREVIGTRIQLRSQCPHCMADQAVTPRGMAEHGFQLKWESRMGSCPGTNKPHYGTIGGKVYQEEMLVNLELRMFSLHGLIDLVKPGKHKPRDRKTHQPIENPTPRQVQELVHELEGEVIHTRYAIEFYKRNVSEWSLKEPREVEVEVYAA